MPARPLTLSGRLRSLVSRSKTARFLYRYATHIDNRFQRTAIPAIDGPAFYKRRLWKRYLTADPAFQPIPLGPAFQQHLETLREDGIVTIKGLFVDTAARVREFLDAMQLTGYRRQDEVTDFFVDLGFVIPEVMRLLCHPELCGLLCNYYGRQAYYREHPSVEGMSAGAQGVDRTSSHVHCDGYRQITIFLLVNDVSPADTHLIYYRGTHREPKLEIRKGSRHNQASEGLRGSAGDGQCRGFDCLRFRIGISPGHVSARAKGHCYNGCYHGVVSIQGPPSERRGRPPRSPSPAPPTRTINVRKALIRSDAAAGCRTSCGVVSASAFPPHSVAM